MRAVLSERLVALNLSLPALNRTMYRVTSVWSDACSDTHPCVLHETWRELAAKVRDLMARPSVEELRDRQAAGDLPDAFALPRV